jgi:hypothetical protein
MHFGFPKTGTTWLWENLIKHPAIDYQGLKEDPYLFSCDFSTSGYIEHYKKYNFILDFNPRNWQLDSSQLRELDSIITHYSISLRNPYDLLNSLYNFLPRSDDKFDDCWVSDLLDLHFVNFSFILERLYKNIDKPIHIMFYDDFEKDNQAWLDSCLKHLGLSPIPIIDDKINVTNYIKERKFTDVEISRINTGINQTAELINRDLTHWLR